MAHLCHAKDCTRPVPPRLMMCLRHWTMVPGAIKRKIWQHYVAGQEIRKDPTADYLRVLEEAVKAVFEIEQKKKGKPGVSPFVVVAPVVQPVAKETT